MQVGWVTGKSHGRRLKPIINILWWQQTWSVKVAIAGEINRSNPLTLKW
jgi:hypothetical protein